MPRLYTVSILFLLLQSGTILFYGIPIAVILPVLMIPLLKSYRINLVYYKKALLIISILGFFSLAQWWTFSGFLKSEALMLLNFLSVAVLVVVVGRRFVELYTDLIVFLAIVSLFFYVGILIVPGFPNVLANFATIIPKYSEASSFFELKGGEETSVHLWFHHFNFDLDANTRNSGIFYEPGRFAIYLILAIIFVLFVKKEGIYSWKLVLLTGTLLTTQSTAGYLAFLLILYMYNFFSKTNIVFSILFFMLVVFITIYTLSLNFMSTKIADEVVNVEEISRFGAILYHWEYIRDHLFLGYGNYMPKLLLSPNGLTLLILKHGLLLSVFLLYGLYKSFSTFSLVDSKFNRIQVFCTLTFLIVSFSQTITTDPFFYAMSFFGYIGFSRAS